MHVRVCQGGYNDAMTIIQWEVLGITYFYYFPIISIILACCFNSFRRRQIESESEGLDSQDPKLWRCYYYDQFRPTIISHQKDRTWNKTSKRKTAGTKNFEAFSDFSSGACHVYYVCPTPVWIQPLSWMFLGLVINTSWTKKVIQWL